MGRHYFVGSLRLSDMILAHILIESLTVLSIDHAPASL